MLYEVIKINLTFQTRRTWHTLIPSPARRRPSDTWQVQINLRRSAKREGNFTEDTDCVKRRPAVLGKQIMICDDCWEIKADAGGIGFWVIF